MKAKLILIVPVAILFSGCVALPERTPEANQAELAAVRLVPETQVRNCMFITQANILQGQSFFGGQAALANSAEIRMKKKALTVDADTMVITDRIFDDGAGGKQPSLSLFADLYKCKSEAAAASTTSSAQPSTETKPRSSGGEVSREEIREAQRLLNGLGHRAGAEDGIMGADTARAIASFQRTSGISATGVLDSQTLSSLRHAAPTAAKKESFRDAEKYPSSNVGAEAESQQQGTSSISSASATTPIRTSYALAETELKASADPFSSTVTTVGKGRQLKVLRDDGEWLQVQYDGREGYVFSEFVSR